MNEPSLLEQYSLSPHLDKDTVILVEFAPTAGMRNVSLIPEDVAQKSAQAVDKAMDTIQEMAKRAITTLDTLANKPTKLELEFGIKCSVEAGAVIAKTATEANFTVKMTWERKNATGAQ
jgi:Trypsin-co-occurring domain 1